MSEIEVHISLDGTNIRVGMLYRQPARHRESVTFVYQPDWFNHAASFSLRVAEDG